MRKRERRPAVGNRADLEYVQGVAALAGNVLEAERESRKTLTPRGRSLALAWYRMERARLEAITAEVREERGHNPIPGFGDDLRPETVIAAAATLSPATSWHALVVDLPTFVALALDGDPAPPFATYGAQRVKAARIVQDGLGVSAVTGPKVSAFARALAGDGSAVVVDRHAARIALGLPGTDGRFGVSLALGDRIRAAYTLAAGRLGLEPAGLQALVWVARVGFGGEYGPVGVSA